MNILSKAIIESREFFVKGMCRFDGTKTADILARQDFIDQVTDLLNDVVTYSDLVFYEPVPIPTAKTELIGSFFGSKDTEEYKSWQQRRDSHESLLVVSSVGKRRGWTIKDLDGLHPDDQLFMRIVDIHMTTYCE